MNFMNFSRHQKQHFRQHNRNLAKEFWVAFSLWSKYSNIMRINCTRARMREPNASDPV